MNIVIMDLDGVLCDNTHRRHLVPATDQRHRNEAWQPFDAECENDSPIAAGIEMLKLISRSHLVVVVTSRQETFIPETFGWYRKYLPKAPETIFRQCDDHSSPTEYKRGVLNRLRKQGYNILFSIDDDPAIIAMYSEEGIATFQASTCCASLK